MKSFRPLQRILKAVSPPLTTRTWLLLITFVMGIAVYAYSQYAVRETLRLYDHLSLQQQQAARAELSAAIDRTRRLLRQATHRLTDWQELRSQFYDSSYYFYWRDQSLPTSPYYPDALVEIELYAPDGARLAGTNGALRLLDPALPPLHNLWRVQGERLYLICYTPVKDASGQLLGYAGVAYDFLQALQQNNTFLHLKPEQIHVVGNGRFPEDRIQTLLKLKTRPDPIAQTLIQHFKHVFVALILLLIGLIALMLGAQYVLQIRSYNVILRMLRQIHRADRPLPLPGWPLPIRELNQLLRLIIRLQHHWLRQRSKRETLLGEVRRIAYEDALTRLPNRNTLMRTLAQGALRPPFTFVLLDIANFRAFNDTYGSDIGDALLEGIAETLREGLADLPDARIYRVGSDEFALVVPHLPKARVKERVETLIRQIEALTLESLTGYLSHIRARAGLVYLDNDPYVAAEGADSDDCCGSNECDLFSQCMMRADAALLSAKKQQQAVVDFDTLKTVRAPLLDHALGAFIDRAVRTGEGLVLHAQPIVARKSGKVLYHELLVRAQYEDRLIPPAELFEWIDRHHLHRKLDQHVIRLAEKLLASGQLPAGQGISINLCEQTLLSEENLLGLLAPLQPHLARHPVSLEVLESVLMRQLDMVCQQLAQLEAQGFRIALDDFGSGYASFRYLAQLPVSTVKIDRSLLEMLDSPLARERELFEQLCTMLSEAEFSVIVEGVETADQCQQLYTLPIGGLQGYFFSHPQPQPVTTVEVSCPPSSP